MYLWLTVGILLLGIAAWLVFTPPTPWPDDTDHEDFVK